MAVLRNKSREKFTIIDNTAIRDGLSLKALGMLVKMLSLPDNWEYSIKGLVAICEENETAVKSALNELKKKGYLTVDKIPPTKENRFFDYVYTIYEKPHLATDELDIENLGLDNLGVENQAQYNTKQLNTKESKTKDNNIYVQEFEELWKLYPRKEGKKDALRHYGNARESGTTFEEVKKGIENYIQHIQENEIKQKYVKMGSSFFCEHLWENEYEVSLNDNMGTDNDEYGEWLDSLERE